MFGFHEKRRLSSVFYSKGTMFVLFVLIVLMAYATLNTYESRKEVIEKRTERSDELLRLEERATALSEDIERLEDPRGVETELRRRYDVGKEGEEVIVFVEPERTPQPEVSPAPRERTLFERIKDFFSGN